MVDDFVIARNPESDSTLPFLIRLPLGPKGIVLKVKDTWPRTAKVYCHPASAWPASPEIIERVAVRSCTRRGAAIDLVLDRGRENRSQIVFTKAHHDRPRSDVDLRRESLSTPSAEQVGRPSLVPGAHAHPRPRRGERDPPADGASAVRLPVEPGSVTASLYLFWAPSAHQVGTRRARQDRKDRVSVVARHEGPGTRTVSRPDPADLVEDLRQLLPLRSRSTVRDRPFPALASLLTDDQLEPRDRRYTALTDLLDRGIAAIADPDHARAAGALLGSGAGRWRTLGLRGGEAAAAFGCGWDAYRRRRANGAPSQLDNTLDALAAALLAAPGSGDEITSTAAGRPTHTGRPHPTARPTGQARPADRGFAPVVITPPVGDGPGAETWTDHPHRADLPDGADGSDPSDRSDQRERPDRQNGPHRPRRTATTTPRSRPSRHRRAWLAAGFGLTALGVGAAIVGYPALRNDRSGQVEQVATRNGRGGRVDCATLTNRVGDLPELAATDLRAWRQPFIELAATLPEEETACAGLIERKFGVVLQPISKGDDDGIGALVASEVGGRHVVQLHHGEYWSYRSLVSQFGTTSIGEAVGRDDRAGGPFVAEFTNGAMVTEQLDGPTYSVVGPLWEEWNRRGGLEGEPGRPVAYSRDDPALGRIQEFEHGRLVADWTGSPIQWIADRNPSEGLPPDYRNAVLDADGVKQSWLVDAEGVRHWIPTDIDYACAVGAGDAIVRVKVPAAAIATLELGKPFRCR